MLLESQCYSEGEGLLEMSSTTLRRTKVFLPLIFILMSMQVFTRYLWHYFAWNEMARYVFVWLTFVWAACHKQDAYKIEIGYEFIN